MLIGEYTHSQDEKKRISLPIKFRKELGKSVVVTHGLDNCLFIYGVKEWQKISEKLGNLSIGQTDTRRFNRFILSGASEVEVDSIGRVLIPEYLREFASLQGKVVFAGVHNRVEVWNEEAWIAYKKAIRGDADKLAEKLGEIGAI
jgi:MraZ protein